MPALLSDINGRMEPRGVEGKKEPFKDNYDVVFQIIVRMASSLPPARDQSKP
jgi:hypothetical protein